MGTKSRPDNTSFCGNGSTLEATNSSSLVENSVLISVATSSGNSNSSDDTSSACGSQNLIQQKITSVYMKPSHLSRKSEQITNLVTLMIAQDMLPLSFVENDGFRKLLKFLCPQYQPVCRNTIKSRLIYLYNRVKTDLKKKLECFENVVLTTDTWTSRSTTSYITVTAHAIEESWKPFSCTLTTEEMSEHHTAENIKERLINIMQEWSITDKVFAIVHDNAQNITKAILLNRDIFGDSVPCFAHSLQLCVQKGLSSSKDIELLLKVCRDVVSHFHYSNLAAACLKRKQELLGLKTHKLIQSVKTRWNSTYYMLERLSEQREAVLAVLSDRSVISSKTASTLEMTEVQWLKILRLLEILKPFETATTLLSSEMDPTISMAKPLMKSIVENFLQNDEHDKNCEMTMTLKNVLRTEIETRFRLVNEENLTIFDTSSFLDPRYINDIHEIVKHRAIKFIELTEQRMSLENAKVCDEIEEEKSSALSFLFPKEAAANVSSRTETSMYLQESPVKKNCNIYDWWKEKERKYPKLAIIARRYLSIPATSTPSERVFSTAGNIVSSKRSCLLPENVNILIFLSENKSLVESIN